MDYRYWPVVFCLSAVFFSNPLPVSAKCLANKLGEVSCSSYPSGGIVLDSMDEFLCGKGECLKDSMDNVLCSQTAGGGAAFDSMGKVKCLDGCEPATKSMCVKGK